MRNFNITVNGKTYNVGVEEVAGSAVPTVISPAAPVAPVVAAPVAAPTPAAAPAAAPAAPVGTGEGLEVNVPMPGTILDVKVKVGDTVTKGQVIAILEAMKMENEIVAPCDGQITSVAVSKNDTVETDNLIVTIA